MDSIAWLQQWYQEQCNGDWEHQYGVKIGTVDNSGWTVKIDLENTRYATLPNYEILKEDMSDADWIICEISNGVFHGVGDPTKLQAILQEFRKWIDSF